MVKILLKYCKVSIFVQYTNRRLSKLNSAGGALQHHTWTEYIIAMPRYAVAFVIIHPQDTRVILAEMLRTHLQK